jgi:hypothetical protein
MGRKAEVMKANPWEQHRFHSLGDAAYMLLGQHNFPLKYDCSKDKVHDADSDRCFMWDFEHASRCFKELTGGGEMAFDIFVRNSPPEKVMAFIKAILKADPKVKWTGWRVLGTINRATGYTVWSLSLFANYSGTKVYSSSFAPNVNGFEQRSEERSNQMLDYYGNPILFPYDDKHYY